MNQQPDTLTDLFGAPVTALPGFIPETAASPAPREVTDSLFDHTHMADTYRTRLTRLAARLHSGNPETAKEAARVLRAAGYGETATHMLALAGRAGRPDTARRMIALVDDTLDQMALFDQ